MSYPVVFPQPQEMRVSGGTLTLAPKGGAVGVHVSDRTSSVTREALSVLTAAVRAAGGRCRTRAAAATAQVLIEIEDPSSRVESYRIDAAGRRARVMAASPVAALRAAHTLRQLIRRSGNRVVMPCLSVNDYPDLSWRGVFAEAYYSGCMMTLADWKELIDLLASLKMNALMVGLYSCWRRQDHLKEFMLMPSKKWRKIRSPQRHEFYGPARGRRVKMDYLPRMFEEDFFGDLIAYAVERGVTVIPYFSSLGHNTLIPRVYPEVSMLDEAGNPKGYGFCTSNPKTYDLLLGLFDECINRYMKPHGLDMFGIGMDEVRDWCDCPKCRKAANVGLDNFMVRHAVRISKHLRDRGMKRVLMWHDMIERAGLLNRSWVRLLEKEGLKDVLSLVWWSYGDQRRGPELSPSRFYNFQNYRPQLGLRTWTAPSAGWNFAMPTVLVDSGSRTSSQTQQPTASREGCEGMLSYSVHDPIFMEGYHALAEYSWNATATNDIRHFRERYRRVIFADDWEKGGDCLGRIGDALNPWRSLISDMFFRVWERPKPGPAIMKLSGELCDRGRFEGAMAVLRSGAAELRGLAKKNAARREVILMYASDTEYAAAMLGIVLGVLEVLRYYRRARVEPTNRTLVERFADSVGASDGRLRDLRKAMAFIEKTRRHFTGRYILDRATGLYDFAADFQAKAKRLLRECRKGDEGILPLFNSKLDGLYGENIGVQAVPSIKPTIERHPG